MKIYRFMSIAEFKNYLNGQDIEGTFVKGKACFLEENIPAREKEASVKQLTDITSLNFTSTDFEGQMKELSGLISPTFENGDFEGQLKEFKHLTLADFMKDVREGATAEVLVEFETTDNFEKESDKLVMSYQKYLIQEIQANGYNLDTLKCTSYKVDLVNNFKNGIGVDTIPKKVFEGVEQTLNDIEHEELVSKSKTDISQKGKSGLYDCMQDNTLRISDEQEATKNVKDAVLDKEKETEQQK